jgi:RNA polymerase sigma-70 factor (ECF subfamily)
MDDTAAVAKVLSGDKDAFRILVERYSRDIFRVAFRLMANEQDADDAVQETFLRAYRSLERFEKRSQFGTWIYRITVNCCYDLLEKRNGNATMCPDRSQKDGAQPLEECIASDAPTPERLLMNRETGESLRKVLDRLTPLERVAFLMRHFEGKSIHEIAQALEVRSNAAKQSVFRAVGKLRRELEILRAMR